MIDDHIIATSKLLGAIGWSCVDIPIDILSIRFINGAQEKVNPLHMPWSHQHRLCQ